MNFLQLSKQAFLDLAVALIIFLLPVEILFRFDSWTLFMPVADIVSEVAMMILLLAFVSLSIALLVAGISYPVAKIPSQWSYERKNATILAAIAIASLLLIVDISLMSFCEWLGLVLGITNGLGVAQDILLLLVIAFSIFGIRKYGFVVAGHAVQLRLDKGNNLVLILILSAGLVVGARGIEIHDDLAIKQNSIAPPRTGMPNVILLSIDALSAEDMSLYGYSLPTTPNLDAFAKGSYVFENFFSSSNWTTPSAASLISGLYPTTNGVGRIGSYFVEGDRDRNLGSALLANGYETAAIVSNVRAHPVFLRISDSFSATTEPPKGNEANANFIYSEIRRYRLKNYSTRSWAAERFQVAFRIFSGFLGRSGNNDAPPWPATAVFDRTLTLLSLLKRPSFIWAHIFPPHDPYRPASPYKFKFGKFNDKDFQVLPGRYSANAQSAVDEIRMRYDEFILDTDSRVGNFLDKLRAMGRFDDSIIVITADHGESFTKGFFQHGGPHLHQSLIHIPLIVHLPGQKQGKRIPFYAGQVDLLPTIMDLLNLPIPEGVEGESLKAAMINGQPTSLPKFSMNLDRDSRFSPPSKGTLAVMQNGWKFVRYLSTKQEMLYYLASDPEESTDLASTNPAKAKEMHNLLNARFSLVE